MLNNFGPIAEPCDTTALIFRLLDVLLLTITFKFLLYR